jgi:hypothetical protein
VLSRPISGLSPHRRHRHDEHRSKLNDRQTFEGGTKLDAAPNGQRCSDGREFGAWSESKARRNFEGSNTRQSGRRFREARGFASDSCTRTYAASASYHRQTAGGGVVAGCRCGQRKLTLDEALKFAPLASALVACAAAVIALGSAMFACIQMRLARRTAVLQVLQTFDKAATDRESALALANANEKEHAFNELTNFLELYAGVCNRKLVTGLARNLIRDRLIDSVVVIERAEPWHKTIERAVFHETTFAELGKFQKRNRKRFEKRRQGAEKRAAQLEAPARD